MGVLPDPAPAATGEVSGLLEGVRHGDPDSWDRLLAVVYADLRRIARAHLRGRDRHGTLQTTALVNEAYVRLAGPTASGFHDRVHFLAVASRAMRHVLIDRARARSSQKRGGGVAPLALGHRDPAVPERSDELLALEGALAELEQLEPRLGRVVEMRFFSGMTAEEVGAVLGLSDRTIKSDWRKARAFLESRLAGSGQGPATP
jgi:RNA polymerase sigma factor (TIGR02999 family)